jgi:AraC family transcriptional regulator of adaptative response / DNA-3-methyladenine glycosylase II
VVDSTYRRTIMMDGAPGLLEISRGGNDHLLLAAHLPYWEDLIHVVERVERLLGLGIDHATGVAALSADPVLGPLVRKRPGLAIPGAWDPFELAVHGYAPQWTDAIVTGLGLPVPGLPGGLTHAFPRPESMTRDGLAALGIPATEASAIMELAASADDPDALGGKDERLAFRLGERNAFPHGDPSVVAALADVDFVDVDRWRPWLGLAAAHLLVHGDALLATARR